MKLIAFNFKKIGAERLSDNAKEAKVNTKIDINDLFKVENHPFKGEEDFIGVNFNFLVEYTNFAKVEFSGNIIISADTNEVEEILKEWGKKKLTENFRFFVFNIILRKSNVKALELEEELNLPLHIRLPVLQKESQPVKK